MVSGGRKQKLSHRLIRHVKTMLCNDSMEQLKVYSRTLGNLSLRHIQNNTTQEVWTEGIVTLPFGSRPPHDLSGILVKHGIILLRPTV